MDPYIPHPRWTGRHRMTLYSWARPRHFARLPAPTPRYFDVSPDVRLLAHCHWQRRPWEHPTVVIFHGLEASSDAHYVRGLADKAFRVGFNAVRLNQRNCGGTEHLAVGLYHSGLTEDPAAVIRELIEVDGLPSIAVAGYSLGGNLALKLAGNYGAEAPRPLRCVCAVSPTMDLERCVAALETRENRLYEWNFVRNLKARMRRKARLFPTRYALDGLSRIRTVREFDEAFTAPHHGFRNAHDYYYRASALRVIDKIAVPTLIITAEDDPFVPIGPCRDVLVSANPSITVVITPAGGHCGFVSDSRTYDDDGYWAERAVVDFAEKRWERCER
jgi:predicted alpha/beta-fold hydrolase